MKALSQIQSNLSIGLLIFACVSIMLWDVSPSVEGRIWSSTKHLDRHIDARLREEEIKPSKQSGNAEFLRRVHLDLTGQIPTVEAVVSFLKDGSKDKREKKIDELGRVDICVKLSVIVGARSPRPLTNAGWKPPTIRVE